MIYWFAAHLEQVERFSYDANATYQADEAYLTSLVDTSAASRK
jgi:hypothetical protein